MAQRLADRLSAARHRRFVGREEEIALFRSALAAADLPFYVLHVYGPGGVGKTTLLKQFAAICGELGVRSLYVDARNVEPSPGAFTGALQMALSIEPPKMPLDVIAAEARRYVLLIDTYELLAPLDNWLRDIFLPQIPDDLLVVFADRKPPSPVWYTDAGWHDLIRAMPLRNLAPDESREYLHRRLIPPDQLDEVLSFTHGHPLALSLVADVFAQRGDVRFQPEATPDIVKTLLEQLVQKVPGPAHRSALEVCALVRVTTEPLLASVLGMPDAHELFDWLRELSFVESNALGLFPHDLAREALVADLRWRNRSWYAELHRRLRTYYSDALARARGIEQQRVLFDYIFLHRDNAVVKPFLEWQESGAQAPDGLREGDLAFVLEMVERHEGKDSAVLARYWLQLQPEGALIFRDAEGKPAGYLHTLALEKTGEHDLEVDPAVRAAVSYLRAYAPLQPGDSAILFRFLMARETYQSVSPIQSLIFVNIVRFYFNPLLAFSMIPCADPDFWAPLFAYADLQRLPEADFEVGGRRYGVYGHDWRAMPAVAWLALLADREIAVSPPGEQPPSATPIFVLSRVDFGAAVSDALKNYHRPDLLARNPLLQSRLVMEHATPSAGRSQAAGVAALQELILGGCHALEQSPRDVKFYRALYHTYIQPAPTQEQAAALLDLPFSTYRRHLKEGTARLADILWQTELRGPAG